MYASEFFGNSSLKLYLKVNHIFKNLTLKIPMIIYALLRKKTGNIRGPRIVSLRNVLTLTFDPKAISVF